MNSGRHKKRRFREALSNARFSTVLFFSFTISTLAICLLVGFSISGRVEKRFSAAVEEEGKVLVEQAAQNVEKYLQSTIKVSDTLYYGVIKNADLKKKEIAEKITLLYDSNKDSIENISVFNTKGEMILAAPAARIKENIDVSKESWFVSSLRRNDLMHFSNPHIQTIYDNSGNTYDWVVTFSRAVELMQGNVSSQGVLLIDLSYSSLKNLLENISFGENGYIYLINSEGEIICHPKMQLIESGLYTEIPLDIENLKDGSMTLPDQGSAVISVKTIGYTGWRVVGVMPRAVLFTRNIKTTLLMVFVVYAFLLLIAFVNYMISSRITSPLKELEQYIKILESGDLNKVVHIGGSYETKSLGENMTRMAARMQELMDDIVYEHEAKRKSEYETLQSQINPHFLYNTLEIIVWMIENEQKEEAVRIVTALGRFFRISLSRGKNLITVADELEHVRNYLLIQERRFKDKFVFNIQAEDAVMNLASIKLILQPIAENAVYHGMEYMDDDGEINIRAYIKENDLFMEVEDNGLGMTPETAHRLLYGKEPVQSSSTSGSGIGMRNVNERIKLYFGEDYGLEILSEPDEGTLVRIHLPAVDYNSVKEKF